MGRVLNTECKVCGRLFYKRPSQKKKHPNHYCSLECNYKGRPLKYKDRVCKTCGKIFRHNKRGQMFCSLSCAASRPRSEKWNGHGKNRSKILFKLFGERGWNGECMINGCEYSNTLDVHRIIEGKNGGEYNLDNTIIVCPNHHAEIHRLRLEINLLNKFNYILEE